MVIHHNQLRGCRRKSALTQSDVAFLMNLPDGCNISRYERGERTPSFDMIVIYQLLFDIRIESLFQHQNSRLQSELLTRIKQLIENLRPNQKIPKVSQRIKFLESIFSKLSNLKNV